MCPKWNSTECLVGSYYITPIHMLIVLDSNSDIKIEYSSPENMNNHLYIDIQMYLLLQSIN